MEEIKRPCSFEAASNMEIKVAIRVKVLVSPLPPRVYCPLERITSFSLSSLLSVAASFLFSSLRSRLLLPRFSLYFGSEGTDTAAGDNLLLFLIFFRPDCYSGRFSRPGNNLRPGCPSSGHYVCSILIDNCFSFYSTDYRGLAVIDRRKIAIHVYIHI